MKKTLRPTGAAPTTKYLTPLGAWALSFGCSVGWGAFIMPGTTFLPLGGPAGALIGLLGGAAVMLVLAANFHYLMNRYPQAGGAYTFIQKSFGYDHAFLNAWFLLITYIAILWANASALPLVARTLLGSTFQFGFHYEIAGYHVYLGEILLAAAALILGAAVCLRRSAAARAQIVMAILLLVGVVICFGAALGRSTVHDPFSPAFSTEHSVLGGTFTVFALAPWAYVGFESIAHSSAEAKFDLKKSFRIMVVALVTAGAAYALLVFLAVTALPEGIASWPEYVAKLGSLSGAASQPTFFAAHAALGDLGSLLLGTAAVCAMFTGIIGNYIALSRLIAALSQDGLMPGWLGELDENQVPRKAIFLLCGISLFFPFLGRTTISWIVDVTTVGATIAYAFASASAMKTARLERNRPMIATGLVGLVISVLFALEFLIPNMISVTTLSTESYLIFAAWGILGFIMFRWLLGRDKEKRLGRSSVAWMVLLGLIIFTSSVWMRQTAEAALDRAIPTLQSFYQDPPDALGVGSVSGLNYLRAVLDGVSRSLGTSIVIQVTLIVLALVIMFDTYSLTQKRERQTEIEKALAEDASRAKTSFLSNMSHEIRTPLNAIIGLDAIALRNQKLQPQTREQLEKIGASAQHLLGLINDILDMSRIESGRMALKNEEFSFRELVDQVNIIINGQCQDKGLRYECSILGEVADYYYGDAMKLKQVLINILGNAVKFTPAPGSVTLTVAQVADFEGMCTLRFEMKDTGIGMDKDFIPQLFEAFSQEDETNTNRYGGSGLGMAITKNFVEMMNGEIQVESEKGVGSVFTVLVTLRASARRAYLEDGLHLPENLRAVMVDDDEIACEHGVVVLHTLGIEVDAFTDPKEALSAMQTAFQKGKGYDLLITDFKMLPDFSGVDLARSVRQFDGGKTVIVMLTGYSWDIIEDEARADGVEGILTKPIFTDSLQRTIYGILLRRGGQVQADEAADSAAQSLAGRRVLMAEDVEQNAEILEDLLSLEDIEAEHAENGEEAVKMFSAHPAGYYDAILMDVRMPVMDGLTATRTIRALDRPDAKTIPIIAMTANVFDEDVERSLQAGMNAHLSKPIEPGRLYSTMKKLIIG